MPLMPSQTLAAAGPPPGVPAAITVPGNGGGSPGVPGIDDPRFREAIDMLGDVMRGEPDQQDRAQLAKLIAGLEQLAAGRQALADKALGNQDLQRLLRLRG